MLGYVKILTISAMAERSILSVRSVASLEVKSRANARSWLVGIGGLGPRGSRIDRVGRRQRGL